MKDFAIYFRSLQNANLDEITEHSLRPELQKLLLAIANNIDGKIKVLHEGKRQGRFGAPDFKVTRIENIIGYIENKKVDESLDQILKSDQIKKYQQLSNNILVTNYIEWIWLNKGNIQRETLCYKSDIDNKRSKLNSNNVESVETLIQGFFSFAPEGIGKPKELAIALAVRGKILKEFLLEELSQQEKKDTQGKLLGLYKIFQKYVFNELTLSEFADVFSQTMIYGIFFAKLNAKTSTITLFNVEEFIPTNFELIQELVGFLKVLNRKEYVDIRWIIEEVLTILNTMSFQDIKAALSFKKTAKESDTCYLVKDPYVYLYEDFLAAYDKKLRKAKGVYYTPPQIVNFIARSVDTILKKYFCLYDGIADHERVTVLDFATGTGTFLLEIIRQILQPDKSEAEKRLLIHEHVLKNLYGFEYLIAPYTIAHLKLSQFLKDNKYDLSEEERFQVFLTNTLEPSDPQINIPLLPALTEETKHAQDIKDHPVLVILGNPPYSKKSKNNGQWIVNLVEPYKYIDGKHFQEKQNWFRDDYVKFFRFAQWKMDQLEQGVIAVITNHTFLYNITFGGMRQSLLRSFDQLYFLDLHGSAKKEEVPPIGLKNQNVFDIEQGVAISLLIKRPGLPKKVYYSELWGTREEKYQQCLEKTIDTIDWKELTPNSPNYFLYPRTEQNKTTYDSYFEVTKMFKVYSLPLMTGRDKVTIQFSPAEVENLITYFVGHTEQEIREHYKTGKDSRDWKIVNAQNDIVSTKNNDFIRPVLYRLFDIRYTYYTGKSNGFHASPQRNVVQHMIKDNIGLLLPRQLSRREFCHVFCTNLIPEMCTISTSTKEQNQLFPLYLYEDFNMLSFPQEKVRTENFTSSFRTFLENKYDKSYMPEEILGYIYAILHSPTYRRKYTEFLIIDFPRIPFINKIESFEYLSQLGWKLMQAHLMNEIPSYEMGQYGGEGNNEVIKPEYRKTKDCERLYINKSQYFDCIPENVFQFHIGGYQVIHKYLKERKNRLLTLSEVKTLGKIIRILSFTIVQMQKIDEATTDWI